MLLWWCVCITSISAGSADRDNINRNIHSAIDEIIAQWDNVRVFRCPVHPSCSFFVQLLTITDACADRWFPDLKALADQKSPTAALMPPSPLTKPSAQPQSLSSSSNNNNN